MVDSFDVGIFDTSDAKTADCLGVKLSMSCICPSYKVIRYVHCPIA